ncbi:hypothetical protein BGZ61DRAFT_109266 [Ilyonectria robusta]|uniref:uncharacterized protein n=1 Tax=Ilyonectria robusta TaxID=1079257 RepID=UPI001E8E9D69|nr:uncharacterized protein BGZ61DRAFT_109266 [Ilyonectria robusta]KAH8670739.1 hypothetical protein BGZ61DRAFT_109266 [Ilyonectria robusta]
MTPTCDSTASDLRPSLFSLGISHFLMGMIVSRMVILHPVICLVYEAIGSVEITLLSFAVIALAYLRFSAQISSQPEFSGHALTSFDFHGHALA